MSTLVMVGHDPSHGEIWVNPRHVIMVKGRDDNKRTILVMRDRSDFWVEEEPSTVSSRINEGI